MNLNSIDQSAAQGILSQLAEARDAVGATLSEQARQIAETGGGHHSLWHLILNGKRGLTLKGLVRLKNAGVLTGVDIDGTDGCIAFTVADHEALKRLLTEWRARRLNRRLHDLNKNSKATRK